MFEIKNLTVEVEGKIVLKDFSLSIEKGETHVLFDPNGSGKTSLILTILGFPRYRIVEGEIIFKGRDITSLPIHERVKLRMGLHFSNHPNLGDNLKRNRKHLYGKIKRRYKPGNFKTC
jgi:Fe-S cluster assembly ATP-binding protein